MTTTLDGDAPWAARPAPALNKGDRDLDPPGLSPLGIVAIGRNEGERLGRCLASVCGRGRAVVYVDSGSTDGSRALAEGLGAVVVELDLSVPFTAARARNVGLSRLVEIAPGARFVMFSDGDCEIVEGWPARGVRELEGAPALAVVHGRCRELDPGRSIYNRLADLEWAAIGGEGCGGNAMMRIGAFLEVGGFDPSLVAGEEPELCDRLRARGWGVLRVDAEMTRHDMAMTRFDQWWKRAARGGYGGLLVASKVGRRDAPFARQVFSARLWTVGWLSALVASGALGLALGGHRAGMAPALAVGLAPVVQAARLAWKARRLAGDTRTALAYGAATVLGKWAELAGQVGYLRDRALGRRAPLIEYKDAGALGLSAAR